MIYKPTALIFAALTAASVLATPAAHADAVCGYSPKVVAVGPTSCPFALNVANRFMNGGGTTFTAYSPETGESYTMHCMVEQHG